MKPLTLQETADVTGGILRGDGASGNIPVQSVVRDSKDASPGALFLCFKGANTDGHDHADDAYRRGAVCAVAERDLNCGLPYIRVPSTAAALAALGKYYRLLFDIPVIGVTGSVGKTTAKEMLAAVLSVRYNTLKTEKNLNNELGVPLTLLRMDAGHEAAVVEMGISDFGEMTRLSDMARPTMCVITRIAESHLETLGSLDGVLRAKAEIFKHMPPDARAIINGDDKKLCALEIPLRRITFGKEKHNDFTAENIVQNGTKSVSFDVAHPGGRFHAEIPAYGEHIVYAALAAAAAGTALGLTPEEIQRGFAGYRTIAGRANIVNTGFLTLIDDCYNANPASVKAALSSLAALEGRRVAILGDMNDLGARSNELHRSVGAFAGGAGIDCLICCGKKAEFIFKGLIAGGSELEVYFFPFKEALLERLPSLVRRGDNVLVKASNSLGFNAIAERVKKIGVED